MNWIDAHAHLPLTEDSAEQLLERLGLDGVVNICVDHGDLGGLDAQRAWYRSLRQRHPNGFGWVTSFSLDGFGTSGWAERVAATITEDVSAGACGVKVWKNVGMELRDPTTGNWVFADDPRFAPVYRAVARAGVPLLTHIAEPIQAWRELDPKNPHFGYFSQARKWHWHGRTDVPTHERLIASRDAIVEANPDLTVIGLHLGSQEHDLSAVAERLDRWPNYHVDTGARLGDLVVHADTDRDALRSFLTQYSRRVIWGVDWVLTRPEAAMSPDDRAKFHAALAARYKLEKQFLSTDDPMDILSRRVRGLALEGEVLTRLVRSNATDMYFRA